MNNQPANTLQVALLGYGYAGKTFHAPLIASTPGLKLSVIVSSQKENVLCDYPGITVVPTAAQAFLNKGIDLIVIATPNDTHFELTKQAIEAGKHVVVDKPFTTTVAEASHLVALASSKQRVLSVFHNRRWDSDFLTLQQVLSDGKVGDVVFFESHFDRYRPEVRQRWRERPGPGGGLWYDLGSHLIDQSLRIFGIPDGIFADLALQRANAIAVDYFHAILRYGRKRVVLHASALVPADSPRFVVHGTLGSYVKYGLDVQEDALKRGEKPGSSEWGVDESPGNLTAWDEGKKHTFSIPSQVGNYTAYFEGVRDAICSGSAAPVTAEEALLVMQILERGCESSARRCEVSFS